MIEMSNIRQINAHSRLQIQLFGDDHIEVLFSGSAEKLGYTVEGIRRGMAVARHRFSDDLDIEIKDCPVHGVAGVPGVPGAAEATT